MPNGEMSGDCRGLGGGLRRSVEHSSTPLIGRNALLDLRGRLLAGLKQKMQPLLLFYFGNSFGRGIAVRERERVCVYEWAGWWGRGGGDGDGSGASIGRQGR